MKKATTDVELEVMTPDEVARLLQVKRRQLDRFGIPAICLGHKTRRYLRSDLLTFLQNQRKVTGAGST